jgi:beta-galactosidase
MPQTPRAAGFTPLAVAEFDLDYSPLLEWRHGKGLVEFCALDLTGRVGSEPAATLLASNLLSQLDAAAPQPLRQVALSGGKDSLQLLKSLCVEPVEWSKGLAPSSTLLVVGSDSALEPKEIESFAKAGGKVLLLPQSPERLAQFGFKSERKKLQKAALPDASDPLFRGIGPNLLRWRAPIEADCLPGGVLEKKALGEGALVFCQVAPDAVAKLFPSDKDKASAVDSSLWRSQQLVARLLTNLGAEVSQAGAERLCFLDLGPRFEVLNHWNVLGPFFVEKENPELMLSTKFPGEDSAIAGDNNPNPTFKTSDGRVLDWRPTVKAEESGFVNLAKALKRESLSVAYVIAYVQSDSEREAVLRVGFDWRARVWVNGEEVFKTLSGGNKAGAYSVRIKLKKGENAISMKIASGSKGHGFFADLSKELPAGAKELSPEMKAVSFYAGSPLSDEFDPYEFHYW